MSRIGSRFYFYLLLIAAVRFPVLSHAQDSLLNGIVFQRVTSGLLRTTSIANASDGSGRLFVTQQDGLIRVIDQGVLLEEPFLDLTQIVACCGEQGLLGIAFHPDFATNKRFFVSYTNTADNSTDPNFPNNASNAEQVKTLFLAF